MLKINISYSTAKTKAFFNIVVMYVVMLLCKQVNKYEYIFC